MTTSRRPVRQSSKRAAAAMVIGLSRVIGRARAVRAARFVTNALRYDDQNQMASNGERLVQRVARSRSGGVVFDVGANRGQWSASLLDQPGYDVRVHAFEPSTYSHGRAAELLEGRAVVHRLALGSSPGTAELHIVREGAGVNSLVPFDGQRVVARTEMVDVDTVDGFCASNDVAEISLLKIDAEGFDIEVIRGAKSMLSGSRVAIVQFEYNWRWVASRRFLKDAFDLVESLDGYTLGKVTPDGIEFYAAWHHELETFREANFVIVHDDWRDSFPAIDWWGG